MRELPQNIVSNPRRKEKEKSWKKKRLEIWEKFREIQRNERYMGKQEMFDMNIKCWVENREQREEKEWEQLERDRELFNLFNELEDISFEE